MKKLLLTPVSPLKLSTLLASLMAVFALIVGCATSTPKSELANPMTPQAVLKAPVVIPLAANEISVMNYNVENLFDNIHDENRVDQTYLPLSQKQSPEHKAFCAKMTNNYYKDECLNYDWSDELVNAKLQNIANVILGVDGRGPDILVMEEVENNRILTRLNKEALAKAGYVTQVLIEGPDERGIDIALLSRLPLLGKPELHLIPYKGQTEKDKLWMARSRGILEVPLKTPSGAKLVVLGAHFPSQSNPRYWREQAVAKLKDLIAEKSKKSMVVASGDLNITAEEEAEAGFFRGALSDFALVSHLVGCKSCEGTHNYRRSWSFLDVLMFSKDMGPQGKAAYLLDPSSIRVIGEGAPNRFNLKTKLGASDHFPIYARLRPPAK